MLEKIIPSKTRRKILELFYHKPAESYFLRKVVREIDEEVNAVKRELDILANEKLLIRERRLNKVFYSLNPHYTFYDDFLKIFTKTGALATAIFKNLSKLGKTKFVVVSTKFTKRQEISPDEIYLLLVGIMVIPEVSAIVEEIQKDFGREINFTVMTEEEFKFRKKNNDPFIWRFLKSPKVMLVGSEDELLK